MANKIVIKKSSVAGKVPLPADLDVGELGVNVTDQKIYTKNASGVIVELAGGGGAGDVVGPASATDNALARFDGTTGKLIQNSIAILDDAGNLDVTSAKADFYDIDTAATPANAVGRLYWDATNGTAQLGLIGGNVSADLAQTMYAYVTNAEATTITKGQAVYLYQAQGDRASVKLAYNTGDATSAKTLGLCAENIAAGQTGLIICQGELAGLNLSAFSPGDTLYLGATPGSYTATKPKAPNHLVYIGVVARANAGNGIMYVRVQNGYELDEIHDVQITSPVNGNTLIYDQATSLWKNADITAGTGISVTNGPASITVANTGVTTFSGGTTGLTPASATAGNVTLSGTLATTNGGTGITSGASGGILYFSASNAIASSAALAANALVIGGGAGVAPATTTTGTGVVTALGNNVNSTGGFATIDGAATLTNKRIDPRVSSTTSAASVTPDIASYDQYCFTAQAVTLTINAPIGTPVNGNKLILRILDNGTPQTLSWNATYTTIGTTLPTTTTANKTLYVGCVYNTNNTRWDVVAVTTQA